MSSSSSVLNSASELSGITYLKKYGYLGNVRGGGCPDNRIVRSSLASLQDNFNIRPTGILDADTVSLMRRPRCGVKDIVNGFNSMRRLQTYDGGACRFVLLPGRPKWPKFELSYAFDSLTIPEEAKPPIELAFLKWSEDSDFIFSEKLGDGPADITIGMYSGEHGDEDPFNGRDGILAHAFGPPDGRLHFNADELWSYDSYYGGGGGCGDDELINLHSVALHEIGHILGLDHSRDSGAVMYPTYDPKDVKRYLAPDDIDGIVSLYGSVSRYE